MVYNVIRVWCTIVHMHDVQYYKPSVSKLHMYDVHISNVYGVQHYKFTGYNFYKCVVYSTTRA